MTTRAEVVDHVDEIKERAGNATMPLGGQAPLSQEEIDLILGWIDDGAVDN